VGQPFQPLPPREDDWLDTGARQVPSFIYIQVIETTAYIVGTFLGMLKSVAKAIYAFVKGYVFEY
jgi:hypothetical protein